MASNPFNVGIFGAPKYSKFPWSHGNRISMDAGKIHIIGSEYLDTGEKFDLNSVGNVTRVAPMKAPTLDTYRTDVFAFACRLRTIGMATRDPWTYEDFFNLQVNADGSKRLPMIPLAVLFGLNRFRNNTVIENLGFPTFKTMREDYLNEVRSKAPWAFDTVLHFDDNLLTSTSFEDVDSFENSLYKGYAYFISNSIYGASQFIVRKSFIVWLFTESKIASEITAYYYGDNASHSGDEIPFQLIFDLPLSLRNSDRVDVLDVAYEQFKVDSISLMNDYIEYILDTSWELTSNPLESSYPSKGVLSLLHLKVNSLGAQIIYGLRAQFPDSPTLNLDFDDNSKSLTPAVPTYFFDAYYKIVSDWFINTAIDDPDSYFVTRTQLFHPSFDGSPITWEELFGSTTYLTVYRNIFAAYKASGGFCYRYWQNDYFTSCFPSSQVGDAVRIPVDGTIINLREANSWQKLKERLLYAGKRWRDVLFALTGKKTSSAIMDMSEVLGAWSNIINVDSVLQQSETTNSQPLANYAGTALGYRSGGKGAYYIAEEPTVIIFVANVRPVASYFQGLHRKFTRASVYDYDYYELSNIGEDIVRKSELYLDYPFASGSTIFGYQRRYGSFMWTPNEVHGDFRGSLDYWHNSRIFGSAPVLSREFLQVRPDEDNLNRIFAVTSDSVNHFYAHFTFIGDVIRHLPKHPIYEL